MKHLITILTLLYLQPLHCQDTPKTQSDIVVQITERSFKVDKDGEITKRLSNKANKPSIVFYFDKNGRLLEKQSYTNPHRSDLKHIDNFTTYQYIE